MRTQIILNPNADLDSAGNRCMDPGFSILILSRIQLKISIRIRRMKSQNCFVEF